MVRVGGASYNNGIRFSSDKYSVSFESYSNSTKMFLRKNKEQKTTKVLDFMNKVPGLRGIVGMIRNAKIIFIILIFMMIFDVLSNTNSEFQNSISLLSILMFGIRLISLCYIIKRIFKNIKSTWQYHGAEHKVIFTNYEKVELTLDNCRKAPRISDDCGTMFVSLFVLVYLITSVILMLLEIDIWISFRYLIIWIISHELFLLKRDIPILRWIFKFGYWFQEHVVTREPSDYQLNQAIEAFKLLERAETGQIPDDELQELLQNGKQISFFNKIL